MTDDDDEAAKAHHVDLVKRYDEFRARHPEQITERVLEWQQHMADELFNRPRLPMPEGLPPLHQLQHMLWGWFDRRRRTKQKFYGPRFDYSQDEIAAIAREFLSSAATTGDTMATRNDIFPSKYLKAADLKGKPMVLTITEAPRENLKYQGREESKIVLHFEGTKKLLPLNVTNWDNVVDATGESDSENWAGYKIKVYPTTTEMQGKTVDCIRIRKPTDSAKKAKAKKAGPKLEESSELNDEIGF